MDAKYYTLNELIDKIDSPNREKCYQIYNDNKEMFDNAKGSNTKHQAWKGGYIDHIVETMNIAIKQYNMMNWYFTYSPTWRRRNGEKSKFEYRSLQHGDNGFDISDALLVLFLHDLEKPWKYAGAGLDGMTNDEFKMGKIDEYGFELSEEHLNALKYVHGEGDDYDPDIRVMLPLSAFVHCCDVISARIWYSFPK